MEQEFQFTEDSEYEFDDSFEDFKEGNEERVLKVRLDKWLWAARFFKTRALARAAVEAGKVFYDGERSKASREIELGATLLVRHGRFEKTVIVKGLSTRRRSTEEALQLFEETEASKNNRAQFEQEAPHFGRNDAYNSYSNSSYSNNSYSNNASHNSYSHSSYSNQNNSYVNQNGYPQPDADANASDSYYPEQRERRSTRFLRRSFMRQPTQNRDDRRNDYPNQHNDYDYPGQPQEWQQQERSRQPQDHSGQNYVARQQPDYASRQPQDYARQQQDHAAKHQQNYAARQQQDYAAKHQQDYAARQQQEYARQQQEYSRQQQQGYSRQQQVHSRQPQQAHSRRQEYSKQQQHHLRQQNEHHRQQRDYAKQQQDYPGQRSAAWEQNLDYYDSE